MNGLDEKTLKQIMSNLTILNERARENPDPFGDGPANRGIKTIALLLDAMGIKWSYQYDEKTDRFTAVLR